MPPEPVTSAAILALLRAAKEAGFTPLLRTTLHKLVYLLDVYVAEESAGRTLTGADWRFLHFGPFAGGVASAMDSLVAERAIFAERRSNEDTDEEFILYSPWRSDAPGLRDLVSGSIALRIGADLKRYAKNLPGLLDYVYFRTTPMLDAKPGERLAFERCEKTRIADFKAIPMREIGRSKLEKARQHLRAILKESDRNKRAPTVGPYDETYHEGVAKLDGEELPVGTTGRAWIRSED